MSLRVLLVSLVSLVSLAALVGCDSATRTGLVGSPSPLGQPMPDVSLDQYCGPHASEPCLTLAEYTAKLQNNECKAKAGPPTAKACGAFTVVDVDYGIVGYSRYFDGTGKLVGAVAHVYEHGTSQRFGTIPACTPGADKPLCTATPSTAPSAK